MNNLDCRSVYWKRTRTIRKSRVLSRTFWQQWSDHQSWRLPSLRTTLERNLFFKTFPGRPGIVWGLGESTIKLVSVSDWWEVHQTKHHRRPEPRRVPVSLVVFFGLYFLCCLLDMFGLYIVSPPFHLSVYFVATDTTGYLLSLYQKHINTDNRVQCIRFSCTQISPEVIKG